MNKNEQKSHTFILTVILIISAAVLLGPYIGINIISEAPNTGNDSNAPVETHKNTKRDYKKNFLDNTKKKASASKKNSSENTPGLAELREFLE